MTERYSDQARNNIVCLFEDVEYVERKQVFLSIADFFSRKEVKWAIGCSMNLFFRGVVDDFHDIDLIVDINSVGRVKEVMDELGGELMASGGNGCCESDVYLHYQVGKVDIDIISGFRLITFGSSYCYKYDEEEIDTLRVEGLSIPLISMEAMYVLYFMMEGWQPKRKFKRMLVEEFLKENHLTHKEVLEKAISENNLPGWIRWEIRRLI